MRLLLFSSLASPKSSRAINEWFTDDNILGSFLFYRKLELNAGHVGNAASRMCVPAFATRESYGAHVSVEIAVEVIVAAVTRWVALQRTCCERGPNTMKALSAHSEKSAYTSKKLRKSSFLTVHADTSKSYTFRTISFPK